MTKRIPSRLRRLKAAVDSTRTPLVMGGLGGFAGLISAAKFADPVLAAGTDTVGSKVLLQRQTGRLHELGIEVQQSEVVRVELIQRVHQRIQDHHVPDQPGNGQVP